MKIWKFVVTGGPCAGKTTALDIIKENLVKKGFDVITVGETATELVSSGVIPSEVGTRQFISLLIENSINKYRVSCKEAEASKKDTVIIYDRGLLDFKAYITNKMFFDIINEHNLKEIDILKKYDAVFHLVTAAHGAEEFYTTVNNQARTETPQKARELDKKTLKAWTKHPNLKIIDNSTNFDGKIDRLLKEMYMILEKE